MSNKTKKLNRAAKLGRRIDRWLFVARFSKWLHEYAAKLNVTAIRKIGKYEAEQAALIKQISEMKTNFTNAKIN